MLCVAAVRRRMPICLYLYTLTRSVHADNVMMPERSLNVFFCFLTKNKIKKASKHAMFVKRKVDANDPASTSGHPDADGYERVVSSPRLIGTAHCRYPTCAAQLLHSRWQRRTAFFDCGRQHHYPDSNCPPLPPLPPPCQPQSH